MASVHQKQPEPSVIVSVFVIFMFFVALSFGRFFLDWAHACKLINAVKRSNPDIIGFIGFGCWCKLKQSNLIIVQI
jgi:hypothetical protein